MSALMQNISRVSTHCCLNQGVAKKGRQSCYIYSAKQKLRDVTLLKALPPQTLTVLKLHPLLKQVRMLLSRCLAQHSNCALASATS